MEGGDEETLESFNYLFSYLNSVSHDVLCSSVALVTALHVTRAVVELSGVVTTSVPLAVTKVTHTHTEKLNTIFTVDSSFSLPDVCVKNAHHVFPESEVTSSGVLFCPTNSPTANDVQFTEI